MAAEARGKFILLLNNDARLYRDAFATLLKESGRHGDRAVSSQTCRNEGA